MLNDFNEMRDVLQSANLRITMNRLEVLNILRKADKELTVLDILYTNEIANKKLSSSAVYQVLKHFEQMGIVSKFKINGEQALYCLKQENKNLRIYCQHCGHIEHFHDDVEFELKRLMQERSAVSLKLVLQKSRCTQCI
ncbi:Fur family transcriptional regulator [Acinetobacter sp.]|uniref:Fur family transcriptional regulator n=1 Tax=Acinetobacter sp. TaxID=472 RepID=UPI003890FE6E